MYTRIVNTIKMYQGTTHALQRIQMRCMSMGVSNGSKNDVKMSSTQKDAESVHKGSDNGASTSPVDVSSILDPLNPPRLTFEHIKMLKNIDYSPLIERARKGDMFTVDQVLTLLKDPARDSALLTQDQRIQIEDQEYLHKKHHGASSRRKCVCCSDDPKFTLYYTNVELLNRFIDDDGRIMPRRNTGLCLKHQRQARFEIKRARIMSLLSPTRRWKVPLSYLYPDLVDATMDSVENYTIYMQAKQANAILLDEHDPLAHNWIKKQASEDASSASSSSNVDDDLDEDGGSALLDAHQRAGLEDYDDEHGMLSGKGGAVSAQHRRSGDADLTNIDDDLMYKAKLNLIDDDDLFAEDASSSSSTSSTSNNSTGGKGDKKQRRFDKDNSDNDDDAAVGRYF